MRSSLVLVVVGAVLALAVGCASGDDTASNGPRTVHLLEDGVALAVSDSQPAAVYVLMHIVTGGPGVLRIDGETTGVPTPVSGIRTWRPRAGNLFVAADGKIWLADEDAVYQVDPGTGDAVPVRPGAASPGKWISAIAVRGGKLYVARNAVPSVQVIDIASGRQAAVPIPQRYAGAMALGVDSAGWLYLGMAEGSADRTAIVDPGGKLVSELEVMTSAFPGGALAIPGNKTCNAYVGGNVVHSYPLGNRIPTACQLAGDDTAVGWNVESGGFSISKNAAIVDVQPTAVPTSVVNPRGATVATTISDMPRAVALTSDGTVWVLSADGREVRTA